MICNLFSEPLYFFYVSDLPGIIYYAHIPAIVLALLTGIFVLLSDRKSLLNQLLCAICVCFSLYAFFNLISWTNIHSNVILFTWSLLGPVSALISIFSIYFTYVFLEKKDVSLKVKLVFLILLIPVLAIAPTVYNLSGFNITDCDSFEFENTTFELYYTSLGVLAMVWSLILLIKNYYKSTSIDIKKQITIVGIGIEFFLFSFYSTIYLASYLTKIGILPDSELEIYGLFGMIVFIVYIGILIVRFKAFHMSLLASQALIIALLILIGAQFTYARSTTNLILNGVALVLTAVIGYILISNVRREIRLRMQIEKQERELELANQQQATLLRFISHQLKGYVAKARNVFSLLLEGDYGAIPDTARELVNQGFTSSTQGAKTIQDILDASNMKSGKMAYMNADFDLKDLVQSIITTQKPNADAKGVALTLTAPDAPLTFNGDRAQLENALRNLIDNTIKYTPTGSIKVTLVKDGSTIRFTTEDTGVGITPEDMKNLFTEGGHGAESQKVNVESTGFGLYIVKNIIEAHKGKVWAESAGAGKGSKFVVELPAA